MLRSKENENPQQHAMVAMGWIINYFICGNMLPKKNKTYPGI